MIDEHVATDNGWPRVFTEGSLRVTVYQPQVESWTNARLRSRAAVSAETPASATPLYGVVSLSARTDVDRENRLVTLNDVQVERAEFPAHPERAAELTAAIRKHMRTGAVYVSLDRLQASLAVTQAESKHPTVHVVNDVPRIVYSARAAVLVLVDGQPVLRPAGETGLQRVLNTRALLLFEPHAGQYYFSMAGRWFVASDLAGGWVESRDVPPPVALALDRAKEAASRKNEVDLLDTAGTPITEALGRGTTPAIYVSTVPAELIQTEGEPTLAPIPRTRLLEVTNSASDIFVTTPEKLYYVLLSGRWYRSPSLERGPWQFVSAKSLPADFAQIPPSHPKGSVLASVARTPESMQAIIANEIPQTATVERSAAQLTIAYDGTQQWAPIEGTLLSYARNAATPVIRVDAASYYAVDGGIWFAASSPSGPWAVASSVPDALYAIPPSSPVYYVTYVRVYDSNPEVVYEGYTPGYLGSYVSDDDVVVYGTGYVYPCWADSVWIGSPWTFGFDVGWTPTSSGGSAGVTAPGSPSATGRACCSTPGGGRPDGGGGAGTSWSAPTTRRTCTGAPGGRAWSEAHGSESPRATGRPCRPSLPPAASMPVTPGRCTGSRRGEDGSAAPAPAGPPQRRRRSSSARTRHVTWAACSGRRSAAEALAEGPQAARSTEPHVTGDHPRPSGRSRAIGDGHAKDGAWPGILDPYPAAMRLDHELAEGQTQSAARMRSHALPGLDLHERPEHALAHRLRNPSARVRDAQLGALIGPDRSDGDRRRRRRIADRVLDEVAQRTPQEVVVAANAVGLERDVERDVTLPGVDSEVGSDALHEAPQVHGVQPRRELSLVGLSNTTNEGTT